MRAIQPLQRLESLALTRWRRSLTLRVVSTTLVLTTLVVAGVGFLIVQRVRDGILHAKTTAALAVARGDENSMQTLLDEQGLVDANDIEQLLLAQVQRLAARGSRVGFYDVVVIPPTNEEGVIVSGEVTPDSIPDNLRASVESQVAAAWSYAQLHSADGRREPGLAVGAQLGTASGPYQIFHLFPLSQESQTLSLVRRAVMISGAALVVLVVAIALLVMRQVVNPVRYAARTAERLAAGRLQERMSVHGEDELARLGSSFNHMADALQRQISRLEDLSRMQRRFVSDVSHELRTPLTTVRMAAEVLHAARALYPPEVARSAELLQAELDRFEALLVDLLEISRYDAGAATLAAESTDLRDVARHVVETTATLALHHQTDVQLEAPAEPVVAEIDVRRIERVLRNLVVNAIEHGEGRTVEVQLRGGAEAVAVAVIDHGVGLGPGEAAMVFQRFWRADRSRARSSGGTGLGLAIALEDVRLHGGWLHATGERGQGSMFRMTLPRRAGTSPVESPLDLVKPTRVPVEPSGA